MPNKEERGLNMNNKAQGLSLNTIIIAILVLLVLVVLVAIFTGILGRFFGDVTECGKKSGEECKTIYDGENGDSAETDKKRWGDCGPNALGQKIIKKSGVCKDAAGKADSTMVCCDTTLGDRVSQ